VARESFNETSQCRNIGEDIQLGIETGLPDRVHSADKANCTLPQDTTYDMGDADKAQPQQGIANR